MGNEGKFSEAKTALEMALLLRPRHVPAWVSMAIVAVNLKDYAAALLYAEKVLSFDPKPTSYDPWEEGISMMFPEGGLDAELRKQMIAIKRLCGQEPSEPHEENQVMDKPKQRLTALWEGELPLWKAYWVYGLLGAFVATLGSAFLETMTRTRFWITVGVLFAVLLSLFQIIVWVGIWRSARRYSGPRIWSILARIMVIAGVAKTIREFGELLKDLGL
jgi:hypothetical protein